MKKAVILLVISLMLLSMASCSRTNTSGDTSIGGLFSDILRGIRGDSGANDPRAVTLKIRNAADTAFTDIGIRWSQNGAVLGTRGMMNADHSPLKKGEEWSFEFLPEDIPTGELKDLLFEIFVGTAPGEDYTACGAAALSEAAFGDVYEYELRYEDGCFALWQVLADGVRAHMPVGASK